MQDARNLIRHGGLRPDRDMLQFDPALSYGLVEYLRTLDMLRSTAGRRGAACRMAATSSPSTSRSGSGSAATNSYPEVFAPFGGFADDMRGRGQPRPMPDMPGIGFEAKNEL